MLWAFSEDKDNAGCRCRRSSSTMPSTRLQCVCCLENETFICNRHWLIAYRSKHFVLYIIESKHGVRTFLVSSQLSNKHLIEFVRHSSRGKNLPSVKICFPKDFIEDRIHQKSLELPSEVSISDRVASVHCESSMMYNSRWRRVRRCSSRRQSYWWETQ